ncbi:C2 domain-containing protein 3-like isoform X2 [Branchiostoma floridae]|uniref:C2 domain-containing protein 3-like isoform X2 n=1 Tax=Branchiostoma floridae TaxID=7739 RepID=A0A9J7N2B0_BRAFL|nr:C2 domain-containing protein 3-like isoform X2 [Branchiostoma floridae]
MPKKRTKSGKGTKRKVHSDDISPSTSLPPLVDGQVRCLLKVTVSKVIWTVPTPPEVGYVRLKWWGEQTDGNIFRPLDVKNPKKDIVKSTCRYPIRCGPKQFSAYLNDMASMVLEVLSGSDQVPVGRAQINQIGQLGPNRPINGFFSVYSPEPAKIGELHVSLILESLLATYDSSGSVPTTDMSVDSLDPGQLSGTHRPSTAPQPIPKSVLAGSSDDPFTSPAVGHVRSATLPSDIARSAHSSSDDVRTPRGVDSQLYRKHPSQTGPSSSGYDRDGNTALQETLGEARPRRGESVSGTSLSDGSKVDDSSIKAPIPGDLISELLDRGTRLRDAMVKAQVQTEVDLISNNKQEKQHIPDSVRDHERAGGNLMPGVDRDTTAGQLLKQILRAEKDGKISTTADSDDEDIEGRAVDLVFGDNLPDISALKVLDDSPGSSISFDTDNSDPGDPIHDESLLRDLFYTGVAPSESSLSDFSTDEEDIIPQGQDGEKSRKSEKRRKSLEDPGNRRPASRQSSLDGSHLNVSSVTSKGKAESSRKENDTHGEEESLDVSRASDSSKVSFDLPMDNAGPSAGVDGLSVERLTLLGRVHVARVVIESLQVSTGDDNKQKSTKTKDSKNKLRGRPPRPSPKRAKSTYFVEYQFPVAASSRDKGGASAMATEVMRVASKKMKDGVITFGHRSMFPVQFDGPCVERWWKQPLEFKVFCRNPGQKSPVLKGTCSLPLKSVLKSEDLSVFCDLEVKGESRSRSSSTTSRSESEALQEGGLGPLKVSVELASDSKDFPSALAKTKLAELKGSKVVPIPQPKHKPVTAVQRVVQDIVEKGDKAAVHTSDQPPVRATVGQTTPSESSASLKPPLPQPASRHGQTGETGNHEEAQALHMLLLVTEGRNITQKGISSMASRGNRDPYPPPQPVPRVGPVVSGFHAGCDLSVRNPYLVCRMFWCDETVRSNVSWGTNDPRFDFHQSGPVLLTPALLERMRNNFMIIEVWDKKTSAQNDVLVGIVKLPLHSLYMSFRDKRITQALLKSQYPVVSVDNYMPIVDPFTGVQYGELKVLLAMGAVQQVTELQRIKLDRDDVILPDRPQHHLHSRSQQGPAPSYPEPGAPPDQTEHIFEVVVEGVRGLSQFETAVWGEADCFVQYHFPAQQQTAQAGGPTVRHAMITLKPHRTVTTLCVPDPTLHHTTRHRLQLPQGTPVQRELLTACAGVGGGAGGIPFEVWCRYYYPNIRDQIIAKATLPLAKLCGMVTMHKRGDTSVQTYALPLTAVPSDDEPQTLEQLAKLQDSGLLDVSLNYRTAAVHVDSTGAIGQHDGLLSSPQVCLTVGLLRASGLKAAALSLSQQYADMEYPAEVGVNVYCKVTVSFLSQEEQRVTRTVARTFAPEFQYHLDFPCPLVWTDPQGLRDGACLAELLEEGEVVLQFWHQMPGGRADLEGQYVDVGPRESQVVGRRLFHSTGDVLLGTTVLPLAALLHNRTGLHGWHPITRPPIGWERGEDNMHDSPADPPDQSHDSDGLQRVVGGAELSVKFAHADDRERVVHAGRTMGWSPEDDVEDLWMDDDDCSMTKTCELLVSVSDVWFPLHCALLIGQDKLDKSARCYIRYKFYDKAPTCSKPHHLEFTRADYLTCQTRHSRRMVCQLTQPLHWYFREERLEVQVWVSCTSGKDVRRPRNRDRLVGSAYIDLSPLTRAHRRALRISGQYPLYKPGVSNLGGACLRVHLEMQVTGDHGGDGSELSEEIEEELSDENTEHRRSHALPKKDSRTDKDREDHIPTPEDSIPAHVGVERAVHLSSIPGGHSVIPAYYVTFQPLQKGGAVTTHVSEGKNPLWNFDGDVYLGRFLLGPDRSLVFKVWQKTSEKKEPDVTQDRVVGFASVDLSTLSAGLHFISGWYNIMDFNGHCHGQIKVSVMPKERVSPSRQRPSMHPPLMSGLHGYTTTAAYPMFPSHIARYPEQAVKLHSPSRPKHFAEHYLNVRQYHRSLQEQQQDGQESGILPHQADRHDVDGDKETQLMDSKETSRSLLLQNLRKNMEELDQLKGRMQNLLTGKSTETTDTTKPHEVVELPSSVLSGHGRDDDPENGSHLRRTYDLSDGVVPVGHEEPTKTDNTPHDHNGDDDVLLDTVHKAVGGLFRSNSLERAIREANSESQDEQLPGVYTGMTHSQRPQPTLQQSQDAMLSHHAQLTGQDFTVPVEDVRGAEGHRSQRDRPHAGERLSYSEDDSIKWEDSIQFSDADEEDVVPVRPLNDVSSAHFANWSPEAIAGTQEQEIAPTDRLAEDNGNFPGNSLPLDDPHTSFSYGGLEGPVFSTDSAKETPPAAPERDPLLDDIFETTHEVVRSDEDSHQSHEGFPLEKPAEPEQNNLGEQALSMFDHEHNRERTKSMSSEGSGSLPSPIPLTPDDMDSLNHVNDQQTRDRTDSMGSDGSRTSVPQTSENRRMEDSHRRGRESDKENDSAGSAEEDNRSQPRLRVPPMPVQVPNFFLPPQDLEASMRALRSATAAVPQPRGAPAHVQDGSQRAYVTKTGLDDRVAERNGQRSQRLHRPPNRQAPTAEEAKRIAKIFSSKFAAS